MACVVICQWESEYDRLCFFTKWGVVVMVNLGANLDFFSLDF